MTDLVTTTPISAAQQKHQKDNPPTFGNPITIITSKLNDSQKEKKITNIYYDKDTKEIVVDVED